MNLDDYKLMAYDKLNKEIKEVCQINMVEGTCLLWSCHSNVKITVERFFEDVIFLGSTGQKDVNGREIYEGHILRSKLNGEKMQVKYGKYEALCSADKEYMKNVGFYVIADGYPDMPLGSTEKYAEIVGHIYLNSKLAIVKDVENILR